jgi:hypothetical protein
MVAWGAPQTDGSTRRPPRGATLVLAGGLLVLSGVAARMLLGARAELRTAAAAAGRGDLEAEVRHLRRAMAYYLPGNPWVLHARDALLQAAERAAGNGDAAMAADAFEQLRSAILNLRGISHPFSDTLREVNRRLAELRSHDPEAAAALRTPAGREGLRLRLERPPEPDPLWAGLGVGGFFLWVTGALLLFYVGLRPDATRVGGRFWPLLGVVAGGMLLFCLGMAWA